MSQVLGNGRPSRGKGSGRHPRQSSGAAYQVFEAAQVQVFKEAFSLIDQDNDGIISKSDLVGLLSSLGQNPTPDLISSLLSARPGTTDQGLGPNQLNFTMFITMMAEQLSPLDSESVLSEAFASFDPTNRGFISASDLKELRKLLTQEGDCMTVEEVDRLIDGPFLDRSGNFHYDKFCQTLKVTDADDE